MDILCEKVLEKLLDEYRQNHSRSIDVTAFTGLEQQALKVLEKEEWVKEDFNIADSVTLTDKALSKI